MIFDQSLLSRREKLHEEDNSRETLLPTSKASATMYASVRGQQSQSSRGRQQMGLQRGVQSKIQQSRSIATDRSHSISSDVLGMQRSLSIISYLLFFSIHFFLNFFFGLTNTNYISFLKNCCISFTLKKRRHFHLIWLKCTANLGGHSMLEVRPIY